MSDMLQLVALIQCVQPARERSTCITSITQSPSLTGRYTWLESIHSSGDGFERNRLICERRAFSLSVRFLALRGIRVGTRFTGR